MKQPNTALITARVEQIESLEAEKATAAELIKEKYKEMKGEGFDLPAIKAIIKKRKADKDKLADHEALVELYERELGMA